MIVHELLTDVGFKNGAVGHVRAKLPKKNGKHVSMVFLYI